MCLKQWRNVVRALRAPIRVLISITDASEQGGAAGEVSHVNGGISKAGVAEGDQLQCRRTEIAVENLSVGKVCCFCGFALGNAWVRVLSKRLRCSFVQSYLLEVTRARRLPFFRNSINKFGALAGFIWSARRMGLGSGRFRRTSSSMTEGDGR